MRGSQLLLLGTIGAIVVGLGANARPVHACVPSECPASVTTCKSVSIVKAVTATVPVGTTAVPVLVTVNTTTGINGLAATRATVVGGTVTITLTAIAPTVGGPFVATAAVSPAGAGAQSQSVTVTVPVPAGTLGTFAITGTASVMFSADSAGPAESLTATGDAKICFVEETTPGSGIPRLDMEVLGDAQVQCPAGLQANLTYRITNNDPTESVTLMLTASSGQNGRMPNGTDCIAPNFDPASCTGDPATDSPCCRVQSISNPVSGDDIPIAFMANLPDGSLPLPADPSAFTQADISMGVTIPAGEFRDVVIAIRPHGQCADGSCTEQIATVSGTFDTSGDAAFACATVSLNVINGNLGTHVPTVSEWGLIAMTLLVLTAGTIVLGRQRRLAAM